MSQDTARASSLFSPSTRERAFCDNTPFIHHQDLIQQKLNERGKEGRREGESTAKRAKQGRAPSEWEGNEKKEKDYFEDLLD